MRATGLGHGVYRDSIDYSVFSEGWEIGRIYGRAGYTSLRLAPPTSYNGEARSALFGAGVRC